MPRFLITLVLSLTLSACDATYQTPTGAPATGGLPAIAPPPADRSISSAVRDYRRVAPRIERAAEAFCIEETPSGSGRICDFDVRLIDDPRAPPNAFQTVGRDGRPLIGVTTALLAETGGPDEIAFVIAHEAGHHIADHIPKQQQSQVLGALILGGLAAATGGEGASQESIQNAMDLGARLGGRAYSQSYELEADTVGAFIAARAGYDPERGALLFTRPALASSGGLISTHPASPQRLDTVRRTSAEIRRQQAAGLAPRPAYAERRF